MAEMFIGGSYVPHPAAERFRVINPANGETVEDVPRGGAAEVDQAVQAAHRAFPA